MAREIDFSRAEPDRAGRALGRANRNLARSYDLAADFRLETVPNASHAYESYLAHPPFAEQIFDFLFEDHK